MIIILIWLILLLSSGMLILWILSFCIFKFDCLASYSVIWREAGLRKVHKDDEPSLHYIYICIWTMYEMYWLTIIGIFNHFHSAGITAPSRSRGEFISVSQASKHFPPLYLCAVRLHQFTAAEENIYKLHSIIVYFQLSLLPLPTFLQYSSHRIFSEDHSVYSCQYNISCYSSPSWHPCLNINLFVRHLSIFHTGSETQYQIVTKFGGVIHLTNAFYHFQNHTY